MPSACTVVEIINKSDCVLMINSAKLPFAWVEAIIFYIL